MNTPLSESGGERTLPVSGAMELATIQKASPVPDRFCENSWATTEPIRRFRDLRTSRQPGRRPRLDLT